MDTTIHKSPLPREAWDTIDSSSMRLSGIIIALNRAYYTLHFAFPIIFTQDCIEYIFDLYDTENKRLIKVFTDLHEKEITKYERYSARSDVQFIVDASYSVFQSDKSDICEVLPATLALATRLNGEIYIRGELYKRTNIDENTWESVIEIQQKRGRARNGG